MRGKPLDQALAAARTFTIAKSSRDQFTVLSFGDQVSAASPLTTDPTSIAAALRNVTLSTEQGTALYDGLLDGVRTLADAGSGRRVLIVLTDGDDISSKATAAQVIAAAHASDVTIYAIALKSSSFKPVALQRIANATGGGLFRASTSQIKDVYRTIGKDLHSTLPAAVHLVAADEEDRAHGDRPRSERRERELRCRRGQDGGAPHAQREHHEVLGHQVREPLPRARSRRRRAARRAPALPPELEPAAAEAHRGLRADLGEAPRPGRG